MGASGWDARVAYRDSIEVTFQDAQTAVLASGDYVWPWADDFMAVDDDAVPEPVSLAELAEVKQREDFWEGGATHSLLDMMGVAAPGGDPYGMVTPLSADEARTAFGTTTPTAAGLERMVPWSGTALDTLLGARWTARCVVVHDGDAPVEVYFWGASGD